MCLLKLFPGRVIVLGFQQRDLSGNIASVHIGLIVDMELLEVLSELLMSWLADCLGLLH